MGVSLGRRTAARERFDRSTTAGAGIGVGAGVGTLSGIVTAETAGAAAGLLGSLGLG